MPVAKLKKVRMAVVGLGVMGHEHAQSIVSAGGPDVTLAAVVDANSAVAERVGKELSVPWFNDLQPLIDSKCADAILIATPHYLHPPLTIRAAQGGLHILSEKPLAVEVGPAQAMVAACERYGVAFAAMYQSRIRPAMVRIKHMVDHGELGKIQQITLVGTNWYRTQAYYNSGGWRGTWSGEGGGVLMNQAPHNLDMLIWLLGLPQAVTAFLTTRQHTIEVENTANILCQYPDGATAYLYFSTAEVPRRSQLLIYGDKAAVCFDNDGLRIARLAEPVSHHIRTCAESRADFTPDPAYSWETIPLAKDEPVLLRQQVVHNFARHLIDGTPLLATGKDAALQVELTSAVYLSGFGKKIVQLPLDSKTINEVHDLIERMASANPQAGATSLRSQADREYQSAIKAADIKRA